MKSTVLKTVVFTLFVTTAGLSRAQSDPDGGLGLQSEITGSGPAGGLGLTHTVWNPGTGIVTNVWLTNQLPTGVSFRGTNKWPIGSPGPTYPEPPPPPMFLAPIAPGTTFGSPLTATNPPAVAVAIRDLDLDGWPDLVVAHGTNDASVTLQRTAGTNLLAVPTNLPVPRGARVVAVGDFNGDGIPDLVCADATGNGVSVFLQAGTAPTGTNFVAGPTFDSSSPVTALDVMDFDGDGLDDLAVLEPGSAVVRLLHNDLGTGTPGFTEVGTLPTPPDPTALRKEKKRPGRESPTLASLGRLFVTSDANGGTVSVFIPSGQNANLANLYLPRADYACGPTPRAIGVADLDGDGLEDLVIANGGTARSVTLLGGDATGGYTAAGSKLCDATSSVNALHLLDLNGDGRPEIITGSAGVPDCIVIPNSRSADPLNPGQFGTPVHFDLPGPFRNLGYDSTPDGSQAGGFIVIGHTGPSAGGLAGGQSFTLLRLTQPGAVLAIPLGDLAPGETTGISLDLEVRVADATATVRAAGNGGVISHARGIRSSSRTPPSRGSFFCVSGGVAQPIGGALVGVVLAGPGLYESNSTVTLPNGTYVVQIPFSLRRLYPRGTPRSPSARPACPGQTLDLPGDVAAIQA